MSLVNPLIRNGGWEKWVIPYAGGQLLIGQALNVLLNSLIVGWVLFLIVKAINRSQRMAAAGSIACALVRAGSLRSESMRATAGPTEMFVLNSLGPVLSETVAVVTE